MVRDPSVKLKPSKLSYNAIEDLGRHQGRYSCRNWIQGYRAIVACSVAPAADLHLNSTERSYQGILLSRSRLRRPGGLAPSNVEPAIECRNRELSEIGMLLHWNEVRVITALFPSAWIDPLSKWNGFRRNHISLGVPQSNDDCQRASASLQYQIVGGHDLALVGPTWLGKSAQSRASSWRPAANGTIRGMWSDMPPLTLHRLYWSFVMEVGAATSRSGGLPSTPTDHGPHSKIRNLLMDLGDRASNFPVPGPRPGRAFHGIFDALLADAVIEAMKIPPQSPRANAYAERFVLTPAFRRCESGMVSVIGV
jgi:hypothetical protein